jgi:hydrogenase-1 operon protein HyaE
MTADAKPVRAPKPAPEFSPLLKSVIEKADLPVVTAETVDAFLDAHDFNVLFFSGDWERLVESNDVAVVLPEFLNFAPDIGVGVVARDAERALQLRYRFNKFPALVITRGTGYLGVIMGMRDWVDYGVEFAEIFQREVSEPPPFQFPDGCAANGMPAAPAKPKDATIYDQVHLH